ncbi:MAG: amidohydrolase family protein [Reichenbachiella sp.]|uniref:metal-dependent hydrolase family protein n=1 Tax=Reichenbachiella sp. TaxID=2184521 RepID=UPI003296815F
MKRILMFLFLLLAITSMQAQVQLIKADSYLDVRTGKLIKPANLLIENGLIKSVNPKTISDNVEVIDLSGKILLPGLMDMHVHLDMTFEDNYQYQLLTENASKRALRGARNAEKTLLSGFTTVRNIGQVHPSVELIDVALSEASDKGWIVAPRIIACGHMIGITGGHADLSMMGGFAENVMDLGPKNGIADGTEEMLKATRYQIKRGAKGIKIMATAGVLSLEESVGAQQMTSIEMETVVQEAKRHNVTVGAHAHGTAGIIAAINAGVTSIEHGSILNDEAINLMIEKNTFLVPTTGIMDFIPLDSKMNPKLVEKGEYIIPLAIKSHENAIKAGVKIALGTDAPLMPHGSNALELSAMVKRGMTNIEAIRAATINPAEMLKLDDRGEIKKGYLADIIAVDSNPLNNIKTLENVIFVMKGGTIYKNED